MQEILGTLIPLLARGGDLKSIIGALMKAGVGASASNFDGLTEIMTAQRTAAMRSYPTRTDPEFVKQGAEMFVDRLGVLPYSGLGQGLTSMINTAYTAAPDLVGSVLGIPNAASFLAPIANGSGAVSEASGAGRPDFLNKYSVLQSHKRTMEIANRVYGMGVNDDGGYNVDFSHGLNAGEMGLTAQRLLSSKLAYRKYGRDEKGEADFSKDTGETLDPIKDAKAFDENIKKLGSKFNETVAMLSKVTGSVGEAINLMDRLGGGNALGGTAEQAEQTVSRARRMATTIRVTAAMAGEDPRVTYANMGMMQNAMAAAVGMDPNIAMATGFSNTQTSSAYAGATAYNAWAASHPNASQADKDAARASFNGIATSYEGSSAKKLANTVLANKSQFSDKEIQDIMQSYREGDANRHIKMIRQRLGNETVALGFTDQGAVANQMNAFENARELYDAFNVAGQQGWNSEASNRGKNTKFGTTMNDLGRALGGGSDALLKFKKGSDNAALQGLRDLARKSGYSDKALGGKTLYQLREILKGTAGVTSEQIDQSEHMARIDYARNGIEGRTMSSSEEESAKSRLRSEIENGAVNQSKRDELLKRLDSGDSVDAVFSDYSSFVDKNKRKELRNDVFGGKMTSAEAGRHKARLAELERNEEVDFTDEERLEALDVQNMMRGSASLQLRGAISEVTGQLGNGDSNSNDVLADFADKVGSLRKSGDVVTEDTDDLAETYDTAASGMVSNVFGDKLGNLEGDKLKVFTKKMGQRVLRGMHDKKKAEAAFSDAISFVDKDHGEWTEEEKKWANELGDDGVAALRKFRKDAGNEKSELRKKKVSDRAFLSIASGVIDQSTSKVGSVRMAELRNIVNGEFGDGSGKDAVNRAYELIRGTGVAIDEDALKAAQAKYDESGDWKAAISGMLKKAAPKGVRARKEAAALGAGDATRSMLAYNSEKLNTESGHEGAKRIEKAGAYEEAVSDADKATADATQNQIPNAIKAGGNAYFTDAVKKTEDDIAALRKAVFGERDKDGKLIEKDGKAVDAGLDMETVQKAFAGGEGSQEAMKKVRERVAGGQGTGLNVEYYMGLLGTLADPTKGKIGGIDGLQVLASEKKMDEAKGKKGADVDMVEVLKDANMKDSPGGQAINGVADIFSKILPFFSDPGRFFETPVPVKIDGGLVDVANAQ